MNESHTIIDIIQKGNHELFHSSVLSWLLDPQGAGHQLGDRFLQAFANQAGFSLSGGAKVRTEVGSRGSRYDIVIQDGDQRKIIIENKWKAVGADPQLEKYRPHCDHLVALGLTNLSFSEPSASIDNGVAYINYGDILEVLDNAVRPHLTPEANEYHVVIKHYFDYLERELDLLSKIDRCYLRGEESLHDEVAERLSDRMLYGENDRRFANRHLLEQVRRGRPDPGNWRTEKNQTSGVWLANVSPWAGRELKPELRRIQDELGIKLWIHIELHRGVSAGELSDNAGIIQLRSSSGRSNREACQALRNVIELGDGERELKRPRSGARTFGVFNRTLQKEDLFIDELTSIVNGFTDRFCE